MNTILVITENDAGRRLDRVLRKAMPDIPLSGIHKMLRKKRILLDGKKAQPSTKTASGQKIIIEGNAASFASETLASPSNKVLKDECHSAQCAPALPPIEPLILFEGGGILVLNKIAGIASHGDNSLETQVRAYLEHKITKSLSFKSGPLHRLDKPTSGVITFSTSLDGAQKFSAILAEGKLKKTYIAIFDGLMQDCKWHDFLVRDNNTKKTFVQNENSKDGKEAICEVRVIANNAKQSLAFVIIKTGRTHQIRASASFHGHPLSGDKKYGSMSKPPFFLHALSLEFPDESFGVKKITAPLPHEWGGKDWKDLVRDAIYRTTKK
ncbi:RNA pseudouridine synthase [Spirochaetia bacterium]|nr:RNA pseudouridine synthase [Spirochaetia bacterium]